MFIRSIIIHFSSDVIQEFLSVRGSVQNFVSFSIFLTNFDNGNHLDLVTPVYLQELCEYFIYTTDSFQFMVVSTLKYIQRNNTLAVIVIHFILINR